ncbi:response regulator [Paenibacillus agricola]|uniref:Response regulator n=1 Tax=Paenibacillus agricola TaxID=2716264 RepID=A0ABX0JMM4_9BACL|nr:helix-turn-helix domain-containing protein [Paenibacillus agricola]NHN35460.1 response regulator [Paenibacillus agricola]
MTNAIKVMIVDDEVLAIKHLELLIPWEEIGFVITAVTTYPQMALEMFRKHRPQVIFADIRMPGMDGLEFSKAILRTGIPVHIVLLTSYKEFDYAKEAVKIGVCDYLLKHELHPKELISVLERIRGELKEDEQKEALIRRQLFNNLLKGLEPAPEQTRLLSKEGERHGNLFVFLLLAANTAVPILPGLLKEPRTEPVWLNEAPEATGFLCLDVLPIGGQQWGVILAVSKPGSYLQTHNETMAMARFLQKAFIEQRNETASVTISPVFHNLAELHRIYVSCDRILKYAPFFEKECIIQSDSIPKKAADYWMELHPYVVRAAAQLDQHQTEQACLTVSEAFAFLIKRFHLDGVMLLCRELVALLESFRLKRQLAKLVDRAVEEEVSGENWVTFMRISVWFQHMFREAIREAEEKLSSRYSWKVRQTLERIREQYKEALTVESLAEEVGISGDRLRHVFKQETGMTVLDYLTQIRMDQAKQMLKDKRVKVYEIAEMVGYKNSQYFSQVFRKTVGVNPLVYAEGKRFSDEMEN